MKPFDYIVLRLTPSLVTNECLNFGVILLFEGKAYMYVSPDWDRLSHAFPKVDITLVQGIARELEASIATTPVTNLEQWISHVLPERWTGVSVNGPRHGTSRSLRGLLPYLCRSNGIQP